jgi:hypothetical protein
LTNRNPDPHRTARRQRRSRLARLIGQSFVGSGQGAAGCLELLVQVDNLSNIRMPAHQHSV